MLNTTLFDRWVKTGIEDKIKKELQHVKEALEKGDHLKARTLLYIIEQDIKKVGQQLSKETQEEIQKLKIEVYARGL